MMRIAYGCASLYINTRHREVSLVTGVCVW